MKSMIKKRKCFCFLSKFFVFVFVIFGLFSVISHFGKVQKKKEELDALTCKVKVWDQKVKGLSSSKELTDDTVRKLAREHLGMLQKEERVFVVSG